MSLATDRLHGGFALLEAALAEIEAAQLEIPDEEFTQDLPSVMVCSYEPLQEQGRFVLMGTVHHAAQALEKALCEPENYPFKNALMDALMRRLSSKLD